MGLGIKTSKEVATAIRAAIIIAKLSVVPIRRGYWGSSLGEPHSLPCKESGKCGSVTVRVSQSRTGDEDSADGDVVDVADPGSPWHRSGGVPCGQALVAAGRRCRHLHAVVRVHQDTGKHPEGDLYRGREHLRLPDTESVEGDEVDSQSPGGVRRRPSGRKEILSG